MGVVLCKCTSADLFKYWLMPFFPHELFKWLFSALPLDSTVAVSEFRKIV